MEWGPSESSASLSLSLDISFNDPIQIGCPVTRTLLWHHITLSTRPFDSTSFTCFNSTTHSGEEGIPATRCSANRHSATKTFSYHGRSATRRSATKTSIYQDIIHMEHLDNPLSNVHRCWLAMPLGAGFLHWVLACRTIEAKTTIG